MGIASSIEYVNEKETINATDLKKFTKYDEGKAPLGLLPLQQLAVVAKVMGHGAGKYAKDNWKKEASYTRLLSSALRHMGSFQDEENDDIESGLPHLAHAICNLLFLMWHEDNKVGTDDR